jgi:hypothetical protein
MHPLPALTWEGRPSCGGRLASLSGVSVRASASAFRAPLTVGPAFASRQPGSRKMQMPAVQVKVGSIVGTPNLALEADLPSASRSALR